MDKDTEAARSYGGDELLASLLEDPGHDIEVALEFSDNGWVARRREHKARVAGESGSGPAKRALKGPG